MTWCCSHDPVRAVLSYFEDYIQVSVNKILSDQLRDMVRPLYIQHLTTSHFILLRLKLLFIRLRIYKMWILLKYMYLKYTYYESMFT